MNHIQQHIVGFCSAKEETSYSLKALANQGALSWIPAFAGMTAYMGLSPTPELDTVVLMTTIAAVAILRPTHPPRLSGYIREAQPWRVFCACLAEGGSHV